MTGNKNAWRAPLAGLASLAMIATMGVAAGTASAADAGTVNLDKGENGKSLRWNTYADEGDGALDGKLSKLYDADHTPVAADGYTFTGWYTAPAGGKAVGVDDVVAKDATLYAHYTRTAELDEHTVSFELKAQDSTNAVVNAIQADGFATLTGMTYTVYLATGDQLADWQIPSEDANATDGYVFKGWTDAAGAAVTDFSAVSKGSFYANAPKAKVVTFKLEGSEVTGSPTHIQWNGKQDSVTSKQIEVEDGASPAVPTAYYTDTEGPKQVTAWAEAGQRTAVDFSKLANGATVYPMTHADKYGVTVHAVNAKDNSSLFIYDGSASKYVYVTKNPQAAFPVSELDAYTKSDDYSFDAWYRNSTLTGKVPTSATQSWLTGNTVDLYGSFSQAAKQVEVTFDLNYDGSTPIKETLTIGERIGDKLPAPTRDGYVFKGWYTVPQPTTANKALYKDQVYAGAYTTFYAAWENASYAELNELLGLKNIYSDETIGRSPKLYTQLSFEAYNKVRDAVAKQINKDYGFNTNAKQRMGGTEYAYTVYSIASADLKEISDEDLKAYVDELKAAQAELEVVPELEGAYTDVDALTPHYTDILSLTAQGVVKGYADKTFRGMDGLNRQDFAAYLYRLAGEPEFDVAKATKTFTDVNESTPHYKAIMWAASKGIVNGYGDGSFKGMDLINRQDAAAMLYRLAGSPTYTVNFGAFTDVDSTTPHYKEILWAASKGIVRGYANGTFNGYSTIVRQDAAAFLNRATVAEYLK